MNRAAMLDRLAAADERFDLAVIGGGATGLGIAVDAAARGYCVALLEQHDFGKGTSSRSTKLVHGGVRYLQQGNISLVMEALKERGMLRQNAPHLVRDLAFIVPNYDWWETPFYGIGMKVYDLLAGRYGFGRSRLLDKAKVLERIPTLEENGLRGGVLYFDGQFDDARLLINLAQTAIEQGAVLANYVRVTGLRHDSEGYVNGVDAIDEETASPLHVQARCVINATGPFSDAVRRMDDAAAEPMIAPSQGIHLVLDGSFLGGDTSIMVPRTSDGRVMFAIPWHGHTVVGTTDTPITDTPLEPRAMEPEIAFILETAGQYLNKRPTRSDVLSVWAGIRPLVKAKGTSNTAALSRDHSIHISPTGLLTIAGGKWTTYRNMAEDCVNHAATLARLDERPCPTRELRIHGHTTDKAANPALAFYGSDAAAIDTLIRQSPQLGEPLHPRLPMCGAQVVHAVRHEMARTVEDVLARRTRALFLNQRAALELAPKVAALMASERSQPDTWAREQCQAFSKVAAGYALD